MAEPVVSANRLELLQIADAVAREKVIDKSIVLQAMEEAITRAAKARYGAENEIRAEIDPKSGEIRLNRLLLVSEKVENEAFNVWKNGIPIDVKESAHEYSVNDHSYNSKEVVLQSLRKFRVVNSTALECQQFLIEVQKLLDGTV